MRARARTTTTRSGTIYVVVAAGMILVATGASLIPLGAALELTR